MRKIKKHDKDGAVSRETIRNAVKVVKKKSEFKDFMRNLVSHKIADIICYNIPLEISDEDVKNIVSNVQKLEKK